MKRIFLQLVAAVMLVPSFLSAQAPGYLGKKASFTLSLSSSIAFRGPTQNNRGENAYYDGKGSLGLNYEFEGNFDYVISRYRSLGLLLGQYYTGAKVSVETRALEAGGIGNPGNDSHDLFMRVNVRSVGLVLSRFDKGKGGLAPVGNRFSWGFKRTFLNAKIVDKRTTYRYSDIGPILGHADLEIDGKVAFNYLLMTWSNNQIFWDKVVFRTGVRLAFPISFSRIRDTFGDTGEDFSNQEYFEQAVFERLFWHEIIRFDIGVGYLLF